MELIIEETDSKQVSQLGQDLWVLKETNEKRNGYFVEVGATDGVTISNTYLLEKDYDWNGIVVEPNPIYHNDLMRNRNCEICTMAVYTEHNKASPEIEFLATDVPDIATIKGYGEDDEFADTRKKESKVIKVKTISLYDLLFSYKAPEEIDYLSIDTEGSEYDILKAFFDSNENVPVYKINLITVEHNSTPNREKIHQLLNVNGYERVAQVKWDDYYKRIVE